MSQSTQQKRSYKATLNLPKTSFPMKANLVQNEPASQKRWAKMDLYTQIRGTRKDSPEYIFHDGPPYANGSIHLGHLLNKVLKDLIVRTKTMAGYDCPYIPGWDCHGLPIEHKVMQDLGDKARDMNAMQIRHRCKAAAEKFVKLQSKQMQRLLTLADYANPYLTMTPDYEAAVLEVFADLVGKNLVHHEVRPVHWSIANQTALADAELEYYDREDLSIYVRFPLRPIGEYEGLIIPADGAVRDLNDIRRRLHDCDFLIWTTTPWTLPANLAIALDEKAEYGLYAIDGGDVIVATAIADRVFEKVGMTTINPKRKFKGAELVGLQFEHPFMPKGDGENYSPALGGSRRPVVHADYVTLEDGTGLVHTAPGHGTEDYQTGLREGLIDYCPVRADGTFDDTVPDWLRGKDVWTANQLVIDRLRESDRLFHSETITHSYPHDWRSKTPVIFRATQQWFVLASEESLASRKQKEKELQERNPTHVPKEYPDQSIQKASIEAVEGIRFIPEWGRNRMRGMLETRPDWCISRQRAWGLPIPAFFHPDTHASLLTPASVRAVADKIREHGSDYWFTAPVEELLSDYDISSDPDALDWIKKLGQGGLSKLVKSHDIFDVWFESGSSWHAVLRQRDLGYPADLYLEGSDQHRGWFQLSLLPALGATGQSPFKTVLTHGFMVDRDGKKMSKSGGNALAVEALLKDFGADVCRWWVASLNPDNDIKVDPDYFKTAGEEYRKVRNTIRFLLSNLHDHQSEADGGRCGHEFTSRDAATIDAWALGELRRLIQQVSEAYELFRFRKAHNAIFHFCNETMSAVYLVAVKDRLYCDSHAIDGSRRHRTQSAIFQIAHSLIRLIAPILPHTADEAWHALHGSTGSEGGDRVCVHLEQLPQPMAIDVDTRWPAIMHAREVWLKAIEQARQQHGFDNPLDCGLVVPRELSSQGTSGGNFDWNGIDPVDCADLCGVSRFEVSDSARQVQVVDLRDQPRCERSWKRDGTVKKRTDGAMLSDRDASALGLF